MILPLEQMVTSKGLSERLRKLGVPQESLFYWHMPVYQDWKVVMGKNEMWEEKYTVSAYLESEIGVLLPYKLDFGDGLPKFLVMTKEEDGYQVGYQNNEKHGFVDGYTSSGTAAESKGLMLEYLLVNGLIKL